MTDAITLPSAIDAGDAPVGAAWILQAPARTILEQDILPAHLARTRWYPERSPEAIHPILLSAVPFGDAGDDVPWLAFFETRQHGAATRYVLPMQIEWKGVDRERHTPALAAIRQGRREGALLDVATDPVFITLLLHNLRGSVTAEESRLRLEFRPTARFSDRPLRAGHIRAVQTEQSNSTALVGSDYVVKIYRKLESGINPEIEMGRFLTEVAGFANTPALLGSVELVEENTRSAVAIVHAFVENQGDAWSVTSACLDRFVAEQRLSPASDDTGNGEALAPSLRYMSQIGKRLAEMHLALAAADAGEDFVPQSIEPADIQQWLGETTSRIERAFDLLNRERGAIREADRALVDQALARRPMLHDRLKTMLSFAGKGLKIRHHGDLHLGQILIVKDDIFIIDFEGEPRRGINERRRKAPAARDVAGVIRSIDYSSSAALQRALKAAPGSGGDLGAGLGEWRDGAIAAFLSAYREVTANSPLWPADARAAELLLNFFLLEKVLYEIEYELAHRPDWLRVPLTGLLGILSQPTTDEAS